MNQSNPRASWIRPFTAFPQLEFLYRGGPMQRALEDVERCVDRAEGIACILGGSGLGKSLACQALIARFQEAMRVVLLNNARLCTRRALLQNILFELQLPYRNLEEGELRLSLTEFLRSETTCPHGMLLIVDEAHTLPSRLLEEIRLLTNQVHGNRPAVQLVLAATPSFEERLTTSAFDSLNQRIVARCYLEPLHGEETRQYIEQQLRVARELNTLQQPLATFDEQAIPAVHAATGGIPRIINQLCDHALLIAGADDVPTINAALVQRAWSELQQLPMAWNLGASESSVASAASSPTATSTIIEFGDLDGDDDAETISFDFAEPAERDSQTELQGEELSEAIQEDFEHEFHEEPSVSPDLADAADAAELAAPRDSSDVADSVEVPGEPSTAYFSLPADTPLGQREAAEEFASNDVDSSSSVAGVEQDRGVSDESAEESLASELEELPVTLSMPHVNVAEAEAAIDELDAIDELGASDEPDASDELDGSDEGELAETPLGFEQGAADLLGKASSRSPDDLVTQTPVTPNETAPLGASLPHDWFAFSAADSEHAASSPEDTAPEVTAQNDAGQNDAGQGDLPQEAIAEQDIAFEEPAQDDTAYEAAVSKEVPRDTSSGSDVAFGELEEQPLEDGSVAREPAAHGPLPEPSSGTPDHDVEYDLAGDPSVTTPASNLSPEPPHLPLADIDSLADSPWLGQFELAAGDDLGKRPLSTQASSDEDRSFNDNGDFQQDRDSLAASGTDVDDGSPAAHPTNELQEHTVAEGTVADGTVADRIEANGASAESMAERTAAVAERDGTQVTPIRTPQPLATNPFDEAFEEEVDIDPLYASTLDHNRASVTDSLTAAPNVDELQTALDQLQPPFAPTEHDRFPFAVDINSADKDLADVSSADVSLANNAYLPAAEPVDATTVTPEIVGEAEDIEVTEDRSTESAAYGSTNAPAVISEEDPPVHQFKPERYPVLDPTAFGSAEEGTFEASADGGNSSPATGSRAESPAEAGEDPETLLDLDDDLDAQILREIVSFRDVANFNPADDPVLPEERGPESAAKPDTGQPDAGQPDAGEDELTGLPHVQQPTFGDAASQLGNADSSTPEIQIVDPVLPDREPPAGTAEEPPTGHRSEDGKPSGTAHREDYQSLFKRLKG